MDEINMEKMAKEYQNALQIASSGNDALEQTVILLENQLELLNCLTGRVPPLTSRTVNYIKNIVYRSLSQVNILLGNTSYVPSFRNVSVNCNSLKNRLLDIQISIFALLDKAKLPYSELSEILSYENRKLGFLASL